MNWLRKLFVKSKPIIEPRFEPSVAVPDTSNLELRAVLNEINQRTTELQIYLFDGATDEDLSSFESWLGRELPSDLRSFYRFTNGFESDEDMFRIVPLADIIYDANLPGESNLNDPKDFHFAEYMIYCDMWTVHLDSNHRDRYQIYNKADGTVTLTDSLAAFLRTFINGGVFDGLYNWREAQKSIRS